ncbi:MAG TPA: phage major capsid protein [Candidatus Saccharicenans sp.]|nr:phage major capsid protein [Candidatus Saccharicenans sp.]
MEGFEVKELVEKVKSELARETKEDVEKIIKLIHDERQKYEDALKGRISDSDFKEFQEKSHAAELEIKKKIDELELRLKEIAVTAAMSEQKQDKSPERKAFVSWIRKGEKNLAPDELKVMRVSEDVTGGYVTPVEFDSRIIELLKVFSPVRELAEVFTIGGAGVEIPKESAVDMDAFAAWPGETLAAQDLKFAEERFTPFELQALVTPKRTLIEDAAFDIEAYIQRKVAEIYAYKEGKAFVIGDGVNKPEGLLSANISSVNSGDASKITADGLFKLVYNVSTPYARGAAWLLNRLTILEVRLLKDQENRYLWQPALQAGEPSTLLGYPVYESPDMPTVASNAYPVIFGNFRAGYKIVDRVGMTVQRLVEKYATEGKIGFLFWKRVDGGVTVPEAFRKLKIAAS